MARLPFTPRMLLPVRMLPATQSDTFVSETVPPEVYPDGIVYVPVLVPIIPPVDPLSVIDPEIEPVEPNAVLPDKISPAAASAAEVS